MKTLLLLCCLVATSASARMEMLIVDRNSPTNTIDIGPSEVVTLRKMYSPSGFGVEPALITQIGQHSVVSGCSGCQAVPLPIKGPAKVSIVAHQFQPPVGWFAFALLEITPETFPPDKTIVIPEGGGANIALECSTNLIDWTSASLGVYTNQPTVKFFRLRAERVP